MINGIDYLKKMYPDFDDEMLQPSGCDLRLGRVFEIDDSLPCGIVDGNKVIPEYIEVKPQFFAEYGYKNSFCIEPGKPYIFEVDRQIKIGDSNAQFYLPRSTLLRVGVDVRTALGDSGYEGSLSFLVINHRNKEFYISKGERFAQLVDFEAKGVSEEYDGDYQNDKHLEK